MIPITSKDRALMILTSWKLKADFNAWAKGRETPNCSSSNAIAVIRISPGEGPC